MPKIPASDNTIVRIDSPVGTLRDLSCDASEFDVSFMIPALDVTAFKDDAERVIADIQRHPEFSVTFFFNTDTLLTIPPLFSPAWEALKTQIGVILAVELFLDSGAVFGFVGTALLVSVNPGPRVGDAITFVANFRWDGSVTLS